MDVLTNLRTFLMVARCGGFSEAARQLHVVPSVAAKRVTQLEKTVGARLFLRSTRNTTLTEAGHQLQTEAVGLVAGFDEVVHALKHDKGDLDGHIRVMAPTTLTTMYLGNVFAAFLSAHPQVSLEVALVDRSVNPIEEGFDIVISGRAASYEGVTDIPLCSAHLLLCAAPAYLERRGSPNHPRELMQHDCLMFKPSGSHWSFQSTRGVVSVNITARLAADDHFTLLRAAKAGCGIAVIPHYIAKDAVNSGALKVLLPQYKPEESWFKAYVPNRKQERASVKALLEWLARPMAELSESDLSLPGVSNPNNKQRKKRK